MFAAACVGTVGPGHLSSVAHRDRGLFKSGCGPPHTRPAGQQPQPMERFVAATRLAWRFVFPPAPLPAPAPPARAAQGASRTGAGGPPADGCEAAASPASEPVELGALSLAGGVAASFDCQPEIADRPVCSLETTARQCTEDDWAVLGQEVGADGTMPVIGLACIFSILPTGTFRVAVVCDYNLVWRGEQAARALAMVAARHDGAARDLDEEFHCVAHEAESTRRDDDVQTLVQLAVKTIHKSRNPKIGEYQRYWLEFPLTSRAKFAGFANFRFHHHYSCSRDNCDDDDEHEQEYGPEARASDQQYAVTIEYNLHNHEAFLMGEELLTVSEIIRLCAMALERFTPAPAAAAGAAGADHFLLEDEREVCASAAAAAGEQFNQAAADPRA